MDKFNNKKIAVVGFGIEGMSVCEFLPESSSITVYDEKERQAFDPSVLSQFEAKGVKFELGKIGSLELYDVIFRSPGINPLAPQIVQAREKGVEVTSAIKVFFDLCPCEIIGVTGTKGKGTTSSLVYEMLKKEGFEAFLGGNIGTPALSFLKSLQPDSKVVLELSSYQLQDLEKSPHIAVMLMTTQEHLAPDRSEGGIQNYHTNIYEYVEAKRNILRFQKGNDYAVLNKDYPASRESDIYTEGKVYMVSREQNIDQGCFVKGESIFLAMNDREEEVIQTKEIALRGKHNWENVCAATMAALLAGATMKSVVPVLKSFRGLEHRIEHVATVRGVSYYDDSFSTTPETAIAAIESFDEPKILILGGASKNSNFSELGQIISENESIKAIIGIGLEWPRIKENIHGIERISVIEGCKNMKEIVKKASEIGEIGDVVLLSPACSSFDMFQSYKHRGNEFKLEVKAL